MKKQNLLKLAFTLMAVFIFTGAMAQISGDYAEFDSTATAPADIDYVTAGSQLGYYVQPDALFHPDYQADGSLTADFTWTWQNAGDAAVDATIGTPTDNYVLITFPSTGNYTVLAREEAPAAFGGCTGDWVPIFVTAIAEPTAEIVGAAGNNTWTENTAGYDYHICGDAGAEDLTVTITETGVPADLASYAYSVEKRVVNIDVSDTDIGGTEVITSDFVDHTIAAKYATATADGGSETVTTGAMPVVDDERTKYEFTIKTALDYNGTDGDGIISGISHKSDYLATATDADDISTYAFSGTLTVTYIVNPAPTTGPIYHIPNDFEL